MTRINIPPAALEAGAMAYRIAPLHFTHEEAIRAAFEAMVTAWPGMNEENRNGFSFSPLPHGTAFRYTVIILPLPTEASDE